jgi:hypothetical protein
MKKLVIAAGLACAMMVSQPALAHKVLMDVFTEGDTIAGEVGFSNGDMSTDTVVDIFDENGNKLGSTKTDADGVFTYKPTAKVNLVFRANLGAGHIAETTMDAADLPTTLGSAEAAPASHAAAVDASVTADAPAATSSMGDVEATALRKIIASEVSHGIKPLRKEIIAMREQKELHSILGGIGYIVGIFGLGFFVMARRKQGPAA